MPERTRELPALLTIREVAVRLSCSEATVRRMMVAGELAPVHLRSLPGGSVRIRVADVDRLLEGEPVEEPS
jgi:excisionase family DNA binding protein